MTAKLYDVIARVESGDVNKQQYAMRFEPGVYARPKFVQDIIARIAKYNQCSQATAKMIYSTSWGACQMMGFNLYDPAFEYTKSVGEFMSSPLDQQATFVRFIRRKGINYDVQSLADMPAMRRQFALTYNGSFEYAQRIVESLRAFDYEVKD